MNAVTIQLQTCSPEFPSAEQFIELYGCFTWVWDNLLNFCIKFELLVIITTIRDLENCWVILVHVGLFIAYVRLKESHKSWSTFASFSSGQGVLQ